MEHKAVEPADLKIYETDNNAGEVAGYVATFGNADRGGDIIVKGAFAGSVESFLRDGFVSINHDWKSLPIGTPLEAHEDDKGLFARAAFHSTQAAQDARTVIRERLERSKSVKASIGYSVPPGGEEYTKEGRLLKTLNLFEWGFVNVPMNPLADLMGAKAGVVSIPLSDHSESVVSAVEELKARLAVNHELRAKEGRVLSAANRSRITALLETLSGLDSVRAELEALLEASEPKQDAPKTLLLDFLQLQAQLNGVQI